MHGMSHHWFLYSLLLDYGSLAESMTSYYQYTTLLITLAQEFISRMDEIELKHAWKESLFDELFRAFTTKVAHLNHSSILKHRRFFIHALIPTHL